MVSRGSATCLVVDDEPLIRWSLVGFLEARGVETRSVGTGELALALLRDWPADFLITDLHLPGMDGLELVRRCQALRPRPRVILVTGSGMPSPLPDADALGILGVVEKPLILEPLGRLLAGALPPRARRALEA